MIRCDCFPGKISLQSGVEEDFNLDSIDESEIYCVNYLEKVDAWEAIEQMREIPINL